MASSFKLKTSSGLLMYQFHLQMVMSLLKKFHSKLSEASIQLLLDQTAVEKAPCSEFYQDCGPLPVASSRDQALTSFSTFLKDLTYPQEPWEIKWSILIQSKQWSEKESMMIIFALFLNMSGLTISKIDKEVSIQSMIGLMSFQEGKNKELPWQDYSIINLCSLFWISAQVQSVWMLKLSSTTKLKNSR